MFEWIKNKLIKRRNEELDDFRSHILNEPPPELSAETTPIEKPIETAERFETYREPLRREPLNIEPQFEAKKENNYEIIDRLNFIENQLSAIKSQVELINERLKNMEMKIGRRY